LAGYDYGNNTHLAASTYRIETVKHEKGFYIDVNGNLATAYGLIAAAEKAGFGFFSGPIPLRRHPIFCTNWQREKILA